MLSETWYRLNMPKFKARITDKELVIPKDDKILDDLRAFKMTKGIAKVPESARVKKEGEQRHGDAGIAAAIAVFATVREPEIPMALGAI